MTGQGKEKGKCEPARWPATLHSVLHRLLRTFPKSLNSWMRTDNLCHVMACGSVETSEGPGSGTLIDKGRTDGAWEAQEVSKGKVSSLGILRNHLVRFPNVSGKGIRD